MISYCLNDKEFVGKLNYELKKARFSTKFDESNTCISAVSTNDSKSSTISSCAVIIICLSEAYKNSLRCQSEALYAFNLKKPLLLVRVQENFTLDGWLSKIMMKQFYFDISGNNFETGILKMKSMLKKVLPNSNECHQRSESAYGSQELDSLSNWKNWSVGEVIDWAYENELEFLCDRYNYILNNKKEELNE